MSFWLWGASLAFLGGVLIGWLNYLLSGTALKKKPETFSFTFIGRQVLQVGYLVLLYFVAPHTPWSMLTLLLGGALGMTVSLIFFTSRLTGKLKAKKNAAVKAEPNLESSRKEEKNG